ncbi:MAG: hypothetical protein ACI80K_002096 [Paracoccaceae bacterium]|jgi:hypothetical protein
MSNTGPANFSGAKAFNSESAKRSPGAILPLGFLAFGASSMGLAVMTALSPPSVAAIGKVARILDQVGLDKGPLLMFGVLSTAMGFALSRIDRVGKKGDAAFSAADFAQSNASSIELQSEILGSVQSELGQIRQEITTGRNEAAEARQQSNDSNGEASDPLFRLAASLDQLGAQIDKRIDKARREMMDAIASVASVAEVSAQQREASFNTVVRETDSVRMDIADLRAQLTRMSGEVTSTKGAVADISTRMESTAGHTVSSEASPVSSPVSSPEISSEAPSVLALVPATGPITEDQPTPSASSEPEPQVEALPAETALTTPKLSNPTLPRELSEEAPVTEPTGPLPVAPPQEAKTQEPTAEEPQYTGYQHEADSTEVNSTEDQSPAKPTLGVNMESLGFPEPPAPIPKPSEGLSLIDEMGEDTARRNDATPPLFPDV